MNIRGAKYKLDGFSSTKRAGNVYVNDLNDVSKIFTIETRAFNPSSEKGTIDNIWDILNKKYHFIQSIDYFNATSIHAANHALAVSINSVDYAEGAIQINGVWCDTFKIIVKKAV